MNPNGRLMQSETEFMEALQALGVTESPFTPTATYIADGDCIEFFAKPDRYYAERVDDLLTVYLSHETDEIVGSLLKGVSTFCKKILDQFPGFRIEIVDGDLQSFEDVRPFLRLS